MTEELIKLLDEYYGESRTQDNKEEVAMFIENYYEDIKQIIESNYGKTY